MTKKELERRIVALEAQVAMLSRQVAQQPPPSTPWFPNPNPYVYPQITCGGQIGPADTSLVAINGGAR